MFWKCAPPFLTKLGVMKCHWKTSSFDILDFFRIFEATSQLQGLIQPYRPPFRPPFLHHRKVQNLTYIFSYYDYVQKCIVIAVQTHFRKTD